MKVCTVSGVVPPFEGGEGGFEQFCRDVEHLCAGDGHPLRLTITEMGPVAWRCEVEVVQSNDVDVLPTFPSIFSFRRRHAVRSATFNAVMLIPTGIDCVIGGHAGDATPSARLLSSICDHLVLHPNVVNGSDINEQTENCLYVEGSLICRLLMGSISLRKVRSNRILVVTETREDGSWAIDQVVNSASAARATLGMDCTKVVVLKDRLSMTMTRSPAGRAVGEIGGFERLFALLQQERGRYDAVALATRITPAMYDGRDLIDDYFSGDGPNPWGGVEAALTHAVSAIFEVPSAHAPTIEDLAYRTYPYGHVDPRKAAEAISTSYIFSVLKGLHHAPTVVTIPDGAFDPSVIAVEDISCLIVPASCMGLPILAASVQGIPVIAVRENTNIMKNDLRQFPFDSEQFWIVENYLEAAGLIAALKAGIHPASLRRPLWHTKVEGF